jgi:hypothetical protein
VIGHPANPPTTRVEGAFGELLTGGHDVVHFQSLVAELAWPAAHGARPGRGLC